MLIVTLSGTLITLALFYAQYENATTCQSDNFSDICRTMLASTFSKRLLRKVDG